jgi:hypothetical protein
MLIPQIGAATTVALTRIAGLILLAAGWVLTQHIQLGVNSNWARGGLVDGQLAVAS